MDDLLKFLMMELHSQIKFLYLKMKDYQHMINQMKKEIYLLNVS